MPRNATADYIIQFSGAKSCVCYGLQYLPEYDNYYAIVNIQIDI